jgi:Family of unknown function (DUF6502)
MTPQPTLALDRVLRVMRPLVRLLLRNGVTYTVLAGALKRVFLQAAHDELAARGMATTDSAVSLLSGVHRRDVRTLTRAPAHEGGAQAEPPAPALGLAAQVVGRWLGEPGYRSEQGRPRVLPRSPAAEPAVGSFDALVAGISRDVRPRAVLDELVRLGVAQEADDGSVVLVRGGFAPQQGFEELSWLFAQNLHDHAAAAVANLGGEANFLDQAVFVDDIGAESAQRLRQAALAAWKTAFQSVMAEARQRFDTDAATLPAEQRRHRARFGVYFFSEEESR